MHKVGIIGFGKMGQIRFKAINDSGFAKVVSVFDIMNPKGDFVSVKTPEQIIENNDIESVFICTPNYLNSSLTLSSLKSGKNVFCEKPPAFSSKEVEEIQIAEKKSGKVLMYGFNHRHHESIKKMKYLIENDELGKILWMRGRYGKSVDSSFYNDWRSKRELAGGGILIDQGIHMLDLFLYLGGDFDDIHAAISNLYWNLEVEDNVFVTLRNTITGMVASLHSTMTQWRHLFSLEIFLERGYLVLNGLKTSSGTYGEEILTIARNRSIAPAATWEDEEKLAYPTDVSFKSEIEEFFTAISSTRMVNFGTSSDALRLMRLIDKIYSFRSENLHPNQKTFE